MRKDLFNELAASIIEAREMARGGKISRASRRYLDDRRRRWKALRAAGWRAGTVAEFLRIRDEEAIMIEMRFALGRALKARRAGIRMTRAKFAKLFDGDSRLVASLEAGAPTVTLDQLVWALLLAGATRKDVAAVLGGRKVSPTHDAR